MMREIIRIKRDRSGIGELWMVIFFLEPHPDMTSNGRIGVTRVTKVIRIIRVCL